MGFECAIYEWYDGEKCGWVRINKFKTQIVLEVRVTWTDVFFCYILNHCDLLHCIQLFTCHRQNISQIFLSTFQPKNCVKIFRRANLVSGVLVDELLAVLDGVQLGFGHSNYLVQDCLGTIRNRVIHCLALHIRSYVSSCTLCIANRSNRVLVQ